MLRYCSGIHQQGQENYEEYYCVFQSLSQILGALVLPVPAVLEDYFMNWTCDHIFPSHHSLLPCHILCHVTSTYDKVKEFTATHIKRTSNLRYFLVLCIYYKSDCGGGEKTKQLIQTFKNRILKEEIDSKCQLYKQKEKMLTT